ncbi:MAG: AAA domain-containing protein [Mycobacteriaceae bacterium]
MLEQETDPELKDRVTRLLRFLRELIIARSAPILHVDGHKSVLWLDEDSAVRHSGLVISCGTEDDQYEKLQRIAHRLAARPESLELVLCSGLVESGTKIRTHIIAQPAIVTRDQKTGGLMVHLSPHSSPRLEDTQLFSGHPDFDPQQSRGLPVSLVEQAKTPHDAEIIKFLGGWRLNDTVEDHTVTLTPALVLRRRGSHALVDYYDYMITELGRANFSVPLGLAQLVQSIEAAERVQWLASSGATASELLAQNPLFPLPSNAEQREIIERLGQDSGVVVEGPPGTGKTHTIANLLTALLARGQRVLVTSEKAQALRVLQDKLPVELQDLCVSITDLGRDGSPELTASVDRIALRRSTFSDRSAAEEIADLTGKLAQAVGARKELLGRIQQLRQAETVQHQPVAPGYEGTPAQIVRLVNTVAQEYQWLPGPLLSESCPLDQAELERLLTLLRSGTPTRSQRLRQNFPAVQELLPSAVEINQLCERVEQEPEERFDGSEALLAVLEGVDSRRLFAVKAHCESVQAAVEQVRQLDPVLQELAERVLAGKAEHLWERTESLPPLVKRAVKADRELGSLDIQVSSVTTAAAQAYRAMADLMQSGEPWRGRFRKSEQQKSIEALDIEVTVAGESPRSAEAVLAVAQHLEALEAVQVALPILQDLTIDVAVTGNRSVQVNELKRSVENVQQISALVHAREDLVRQLTAISPAGPRLRSLQECAEVAAAAGAIASYNDAALARKDFQSIYDRVTQAVELGPSAEGDALLSALRSQNAEAIILASRQWNIARQEQADQAAVDLFLLRLRAKAPELVEMLVETSSFVSWPDRIRHMDLAWDWRRAQQWVIEQSQPGLEQELDVQLDAVEADIAQLTTRLAAAQAWRECLRKMTSQQVQALQAYRDHVSNVGKGSGKYAERFQASARAAMKQAQGAVPAWVMPLGQVLASIAPEPNSFDVVIVDEASQADITSSFLLWLAPRVIVVGDDKQCAPSEVSSGGLDEVFSRLDSYLPDIPGYLRDSLTPRSSLFTMLRSRFGQVVRLREHFRSMPEIITWSSQQFYADAPLVPVRQYGADRLAPLKTVRINDAIAEGKSATLSNEKEADSIVATLTECFADSAYQGKTFGVVVLQGQSQVDLIEAKLFSCIEQSQWDSRRLRVGTPPDFQGDERDIILLSMVVAPGEGTVAALTRNEFQRRFNVAASRAKDQMWLFHSVDAEALKEKDLRRSLLTYMQSVSPAPVEIMPARVPRDERVIPFESLFEQDVFCDIAARGFHVNPQVRVNNRSIDLVVTGSQARMAVECDGDGFQASAEQQYADLEREREIKRCGWQFWRVRESEYYLDREAALESLWTALERQGVEPYSVQLSQDPVVQTSAWGPVQLDGIESGNDSK